MDYASVSAIYEEIESLVPVYREARRNMAAGGRWPFLREGRFSFEDGLARLRLPEMGNPEDSEALIGEQ